MEIMKEENASLKQDNERMIELCNKLLQEVAELKTTVGQQKEEVEQQQDQIAKLNTAVNSSGFIKHSSIRKVVRGMCPLCSTRPKSR